MKFVMLVEGKTEKGVLQQFLDRFLNKKLENRVGVKIAIAVSLKDLKIKATNYLTSPNSSDYIAVIGLRDLYGFEEIKRGNRSKDEFYTYAIDKIEKEINQPKFKMFFAVHELEAWLFSQPDIFHRKIQSQIKHIGSQPEQINFDHPPAKLLGEIYRNHLGKNYGKTTDGWNLFNSLDPGVACEKCPKLKEMLDEMLELATRALPES